MKETIEIEVTTVSDGHIYVASCNGADFYGHSEEDAIIRLVTYAGFDDYEEVEETNEPEPFDFVEFCDGDGYADLESVDGKRSAIVETGKRFYSLFDGSTYCNNSVPRRTGRSRGAALRWVVDGELP